MRDKPTVGLAILIALVACITVEHPPSFKFHPAPQCVDGAMIHVRVLKERRPEQPAMVQMDFVDTASAYVLSPDGKGSYLSRCFLAPRRDHISANTDVASPWLRSNKSIFTWTPEAVQEWSCRVRVRKDGFVPIELKVPLKNGFGTEIRLSLRRAHSSRG